MDSFEVQRGEGAIEVTSNMERISVTLLRALVEHNTTGWVVKKLAEFQEENRNPECAKALRSIIVERPGITYVVSELGGARPQQPPIDLSAIPHSGYFRQPPLRVRER